MVYYNSISNATLSTVLTELGNAGIDKSRIVNIIHDGTLYIAVYVVNN